MRQRFIRDLLNALIFNQHHFTPTASVSSQQMPEKNAPAGNHFHNKGEKKQHQVYQGDKQFYAQIIGCRVTPCLPSQKYGGKYTLGSIYST